MATAEDNADSPGGATVTLRFYEELNDHLPADKRKRGYQVPLFLSPAVKDVIEAEGVPHTEVEIILVNGVSVGFGHRLRPGDRVAVYPVFESLDVSPLIRLRPAPLRELRFVIDVHLGRLARRLRLLGLDCLWRDDLGDDEIAALSVGEGRVILTRDRGLLKRADVTRGYWLRNLSLDDQVRELLRRFDLAASLRPFSRCMHCNTELESVDRGEVLHRLPPAVAREHEEFLRCPGCGRVYWRGSHYRALRDWVADVLSGMSGEHARADHSGPDG